MSEKLFSTRVLAEAAMVIALSVVLSNVKIFRMPQGGSVTAGSMIPLLWISLRRGFRVGLLTCTVYGVVRLLLPGSYVVLPVQGLLDYPVAFGALGLAGLFKRYPLIGVDVGMLGRFIAHFVAGVVFFAEFAPTGMSPIVYSIIYNGGYMSVEYVVSAIFISHVLIKRGLLEIYL